MPACFLTVRFPWRFVNDDWDRPPKGPPPSVHEKHGHVFYQTDSQIVAERLVEVFRSGLPAAAAPNPNATWPERYLILGAGCEKGGSPFAVFEIVNGADLSEVQRVQYKSAVAALAAACTSGITLDVDRADDRRRALLWAQYGRAHELEPLIRGELDVAHGRAKGFYLWWTWWAVYPQEPTANLKERTYFYRVDTEDVAVRLCRAFGRCHGIDIRFGYTASEALDIDETVRANNSIEKYRRGEYTGEDAVAHLFTDARQWEHALPTCPGSEPPPQEAADDVRCAATHEGPDGSPDIPRKSEPTSPGGNAQQPPQNAAGGKPEDAHLEEAKTPSAPETHCKSQPAPGSVQTCNVICPNGRLAGVLRQAGLNTVSVLERPVYEYDPALYVHCPEVVLGFPAAIKYPAAAMHLWPQQFANLQEAMTSALVAAGHPPLAKELPEQYENLLKGLRSGALIAVAFVEPVKVDVRFRKYDSNEGAAEGSAISIEDAARQFGALPPEREYAVEGLWGVVPVAVDLAEYRDEEPVAAAEGFRFEPQEPPDSRLVVPKDAPQWASELLPFLGPTIDVRLDTTWFKEKDRLVPLFQNMAGDLLGCAYRTGKGVVLLLPRCKDEAAKARLIGVLATDQWQPVQAWLLVQNECDSWGADRPCAFSVRPCNEARPELKHLLQAVKLHRLLFLWYAHARQQNCAARWETLDRREVFDPDDLKQHRGDQPLPAEVLLRHAKGVEDFANAAYEMFGAGKGVGNVFDEGVCVFWPEWQVEADGVGPLEASADEICRLAIAVLGQHTPDWACIGIVEKCRGVARSGFPRWSPHPVSWRYLEELDSAIVSLNHAIWEEEAKSGTNGLGAASPKPGTGQEGRSSSDSGDGKMPTVGSAGAKPEPPPSRKKACEAYRAALSHKQELVSRTHKAVFLWLRDGGLEELKTAALIPREYTLPTRAATFDRYVREYEQHLASTRSGRSAPYGSIPRADQI
jgi:hypothetical protein